jgi:hypothetical protein
LLGFCLVPLGSRPHVDHPELFLSKPWPICPVPLPNSTCPRNKA